MNLRRMNQNSRICDVYGSAVARQLRDGSPCLIENPDECVFPLPRELARIHFYVRDFSICVSDRSLLDEPIQ